MPILGAALDFAKYEARNIRSHQLGTAPATPVTGQFYYNTGDNTLYWWDGSQWVSARGGAAAIPPATTGALGTIQLAGDLAGTATSPQIAAGVITHLEVAAANKDGTAGTASMRTLGQGAGQALPGNTNLNDVLAPVGSVNFNNQKLIGLGTPTAPTDGATMGYVDTVAQGLDAKASVKAASVGSLSLTGPLTVDGIGLVANDRVLVKDQTPSFNNGIYVVQAGAWTRATDADSWNDLVSAFVFVEQGTVNADSGWVCIADAGGTLGSTVVGWVQFSGAGQITAGGGLTKTGNTIDAVAGAGITVNADSIQVANNGITNAMLADGAVNLGSMDVTSTLQTTNGGTGSTTPYDARTTLGTAGYYSTATHGAGTTISILRSTHLLRPSRGLLVQVQDEASGIVEFVDIVVAASGDVSIGFGASVAANSKRVTIVG